MVEATMRARSSAYLEWAKLAPPARFPLTYSGISSVALAELPIRVEDLELTGPAGYAWPPLIEALAKRCGVATEHVVHAAGTSMANHLAMATLVDAGDDVLIEKPAYEPLLSLASYVGAEIRRFDRRSGDGFRLDPEAVARALTPRTRLIVLTNLHNPSSVQCDEAALRAVGELARSVGARVLCDEVYLDAVFEDSTRSAAHLGPEFVVTSSLTKVYGLSGLRCGWVVAEPELAHRMRRLTEIYDNNAPHLAERVSLVALANLDGLRERSRALLTANHALYDAFLDGRDELAAVRTRFGTTSFPRLLRGDVDALCRLLRERYETAVVPGHFFEEPDHFRIGLGCATEVLRAGLERLGAALDEL
jgi:aspartate/methionine/tyrosine aminotransferase